MTCIKLTFGLLLVCFSSIAQKKNIALTPPTGWNTWNSFHCDVDEKLIRESAYFMVSSGMKDAGYEYIVIDDCWQISRDSTGKIVADPKHFPSGIKALSDYVHTKGLKFGLYSDVGKMTCQRRPGGRGMGSGLSEIRLVLSWELGSNCCLRDHGKCIGFSRPRNRLQHL